MTAFDLDAYLSRIGSPAVGVPDLATLEAVHRGHATHIPFENLDVYLGRPVAIDLPAIEAKLVRGGRGGYCFEQNSLLAAALRALGFAVDPLEARVRPPGATAPLPRTHMVLRVDVAGRDWLADVGFGGDGPLLPVPLDGAVSEQPGDAYRVDPEGDGVRVLRRRVDGRWIDVYAFTLAPVEPVDLEVAHHYTSTHPRSRFVLTMTAQRSEPHVRHVLRGRRYAVVRDGVESARDLADHELAPLLRDTFRLRLDDDLVAALVEKLGHSQLSSDS